MARLPHGSSFQTPPVSKDAMAAGLTRENLATAIKVRSMPEERRILHARYRFPNGDPLVESTDPKKPTIIEHEGRHLHLIAFHHPEEGYECGIIFDVTDAVALIPDQSADEVVSEDNDRRLAEFNAYIILDKGTLVESTAGINSLVKFLVELGPEAIGALRYSLRDIDLNVAGLAARALAQIGDASDLSRLRARMKVAPDIPGISEAVAILEVRSKSFAKTDEVWRPAALSQ